MCTWISHSCIVCTQRYRRFSQLRHLPVLLCEGVGDVATASGAVVAMGVARSCKGCICAAADVVAVVVCVAAVVSGNGGGGNGGCGLTAVSRPLLWLGLRLLTALLAVLLRCRLAVMQT